MASRSWHLHTGSWPPVFLTLDTATKHRAHYQSKSLSFHRSSFPLCAARHAAQYFMPGVVLAWTMRWNKGAWCGRELASSSGSRYGPPGRALRTLYTALHGGKEVNGIIYRWNILKSTHLIGFLGMSIPLKSMY